MMMVVFEEPRANEVDHKAKDGNHNRLFVGDSLGVKDAFYGVKRHEKRHYYEQHRTGVAAQDFYLKGAKVKANIAGVFGRHDVGKVRHAKGQNV